jgi:hypothetical protein
MKTKKSGRSKRRSINKALDQRFSLRNQRAPLQATDRGGKSLLDLPDATRRRKRPQGPRRLQLGRTLRQGELATRDPVREE